MNKLSKITTLWIGIISASAVNAADINSKDAKSSFDHKWPESALNKSSIKEETILKSKELLEIVEKRRRELEIIGQAEDILNKIEDNEVAMDMKNKNHPELIGSSFEFFKIEQTVLVWKLLDIYTTLPEDPDMCFIMWKYLYDHSKNKTKAIEYFKKALSKSSKYSEYVHKTLFADIISTIISYDEVTNDERFRSIVLEMWPHIWPALKEARSVQSDDTIKNRFDYFLKLLDSAWIENTDKMSSSIMPDSDYLHWLGSNI